MRLRHCSDMKGEELTPWLLRYGYEQAAFPMTLDDDEVEWFLPHERALLPIQGIHVSKSLARRIRRTLVEPAVTEPSQYAITFDTAFESVMRACFRPDENWLSEHFVRAYTECHRQGWAHSCECWLDGSLVGGVYGLALGTCFCAESMFHRSTDASKLALWAMVNRARELGFTIFDAQIMNPHLHSLGAFSIPHAKYLQMLEKALERETVWSVASR